MSKLGCVERFFGVPIELPKQIDLGFHMPAFGTYENYANALVLIFGTLIKNVCSILGTGKTSSARVIANQAVSF